LWLVYYLKLPEPVHLTPERLAAVS